MESISLLGLWALMALPVIAALYWRRRHLRVQRVAGLFMWAGAAREAGRLAPESENIGLPAAFDIAVAVLLVILAWGVLPAESQSEAPFGDRVIVALRIIVCGVCVALVVTLWKWKGSASDKNSVAPVSQRVR